MRHVRVVVRIGKVGNDCFQFASGPDDAAELPHEEVNSVDVLHEMRGKNVVERGVRNTLKYVEDIADYVYALVIDRIYADIMRSTFACSAPEIELSSFNTI
jgi:hypothetical protein